MQELPGVLEYQYRKCELCSSLGGIMKKYKVTFVDEIEAETLEEAYYQLRLYLSKCQHNDDISVFEFEEIKE
mgnify:FL=1